MSRRLQQMFDVPVPREHAGRKSVRKCARPWEAAVDADETVPHFNRAQRRALMHGHRHHAH